MGSPTRITALSSRSAYALRRASRLETSARGDVAPSFGRKSGSSPEVSSNRLCTLRGVIVQPSDATWQLTQARPFVPRLWKNRPLVSITPPGVRVRPTPLPFGANTRSSPGTRTCDTIAARPALGRAGGSPVAPPQPQSAVNSAHQRIEQLRAIASSGGLRALRAGHAGVDVVEHAVRVQLPDPHVQDPEAELVLAVHRLAEDGRRGGEIALGRDPFGAVEV